MQNSLVGVIVLVGAAAIAYIYRLPRAQTSAPGPGCLAAVAASLGEELQAGLAPHLLPRLHMAGPNSELGSALAACREPVVVHGAATEWAACGKWGADGGDGLQSLLGARLRGAWVVEPSEEAAGVRRPSQWVPHIAKMAVASTGAGGAAAEAASGSEAGAHVTSAITT